MTVAELVSELLFAGKSRREIAGYDDRFMAFVLGLRRDQHGKLVRKMEGLPSYVEVDSDGMNVVSPDRQGDFGSMFMQVQGYLGTTRREAKGRWENYLRDNPKLKVRASGDWDG